MFRKKKESQESLENSSIVVHDKPLICLFDLDEEIFKGFAAKSYRCTEGTIGSLVRVPNNQRRDQHFLKLNYSAPINLHEYDVLIFDMGINKEVDYDKKQFSLDNVTGKSTYALLSEFPEKIFNPKPYATKILSKSINELLEKESLVIIFAGKEESVEYHQVEINSYHNQITPTEAIYNTCFYDGFPSCFNKMGTKFKSPDKKITLTPFLLRYCNQSHYELIFHHPTYWNGQKQEEDNSFIPLLLNESGEIVSYYHHRSNGSVFVFPQIENKKDFLLDLFSNHLAEIFPNLFPYHGQFGWLDNGDYPLPGEIKLRAEREILERRYREEIEANDKALSKMKEEYLFLSDIISGSGNRLVNSVEHYLKWLGFQSVVNLDDTNPDVLEEDLQVDCGDRFLVAEVKGIGGTSTDKDCSQISKIRYRRAEQRGKFDVFGLYIVNHQRYTPPESRSNPPFSESQIKDALLDKRGLLTTYELFRAYFLIEKDLLSKETVRELFFETGLITLQPGNLKSIGIADEIFKDGKVAIVNLEGIPIKKGDSIVARKGSDYEKLKIISLRINDRDVDEADSGEVGIMFDKKIKRKSELYLQKV